MTKTDPNNPRDGVIIYCLFASFGELNTVLFKTDTRFTIYFALFCVCVGLQAELFMGQGN